MGDAAALEAVDGEAAGGDVEEGLGLRGRLLGNGGMSPDVGVVGDVLSLSGVAEEPGEVAARARV